EQDGPEALARLAEALDAPAVPPAAPRPLPEGPARGAIGPEGVAAILARALPEDAIVVDESISYGRDLFAALAAAAPHDWLQLCGGAIGEGLPLATGAAIGAPGRRVIVLQGDGSAMYTLQALWTQARERLDVTTILLANRKYAILLKEFAGVGAFPGPTAHGMMDLADPALDWPRLAGGMGVEAGRADTLERFAELLDKANRRPGPFLIELVV
ncbi:MAG: thiamine pyrophosphate-dependent enzyme, partial [Acetobacteraceae bacterium]